MNTIAFKRFALAFGLTAVVAALGLVGWSICPFMSSGRTIPVSEWRSGKYEFQIWQRKNASLLEPFTTAMFVRIDSNHVWRAFSLGFQDCYTPHVAFKQSGSHIEITCGKKQLGKFDLADGEYFRIGQTHPINEGITTSPSMWWTSSGF